MPNDIFNLASAGKGNYSSYFWSDRLLNFSILIILTNIFIGCVKSSPLPKPTPTATINASITLTTPTVVSDLAITPTYTASPKPFSTPSPASSLNGTVTLMEPLDSVISGPQIFRWSSNIVLRENQLFELVFWRAGQDPVSYGFGPVGTSRTTETRIDLDRAAALLPQLLISGQDYQWGVLLVEGNPYRRLSYLGGGHFFRFESKSDSSENIGSGNGRDPVPPTPTPRG